MSISRRARLSAAHPAEPDIPARLLHSARELLAERGLSGFKVLEVASRAQANVAMINYHYGGRDGLLDEVIRHAAGSIARARAARLTDLLDTHGRATPPPAADVLRCWLEPMFESVEVADNRELMMLMVHLMFAADVPQERKTHILDEAIAVTETYLDVLARCLPAVPRETLAWRMLCAVGATYVVLGQRDPVGLKRLASRTADLPPSLYADRLQQTLAFILAGISAPPAVAAPKDMKARRRAKP